jgi:hypothetical protein
MNPNFMQLLADNFRKWAKLMNIANEYDDEDLTKYILEELKLVSKDNWKLLEDKADEDLPNIL